MSDPDFTLLDLAAAYGSSASAVDIAPIINGVRELVELVNTTSVTRLEFGAGSVRVEIEAAPPAPAPAPAPAVAPVAAAAAAAAAAVAPAVAAEAGAVATKAPPGATIKALLIGVFYRSPGPGTPPFVEVGDRVEAGQQIAIVEAMKMMNPVVADRAGIIREILVADGEVAEFDQPLFTVEPC